jgi:rare lipoprotein A
MMGSKLSLTLILLLMATCPVRGEDGMASFYGGGRTASGEVTGPAELTAAHRTLAFGTKVLVTNIGNGKTVIVRITDRGPFGRRRIIDVSRAAARALDMIDSGTTMVRVVRQENTIGEGADRRAMAISSNSAGLESSTTGAQGKLPIR